MFKIYTDGACKGNPGKGGWGFVIYNNKLDKIMEKSGFCDYTTNNKMELIAVIEAIEAFITLYKNNEKMILYTDSVYVRNGICKWIHTWKNNDWMTCNKDPVKNKDLWQKLDILLDPNRFQFEWVKAHNGNIGNEYADKLANMFIK